MNDPVRSALLRFLARKTPRRGMSEEAQRDEETALCEALHRAAPVKHPSEEWAEDFLKLLERRKEAPVWPTVGEIEKLAAEKRKEAPSERETAEVLRGAALFAKRIRNGGRVAEIDLWGPVAVEAYKEHGITAEEITTRRALCVEAWAAFYGKEHAQKLLDEQERRWADAKAAYGKPSGKTVSAERRAELVAWAREVVQWERVEDRTHEPQRHLPDPDELERARAENPIVRAIRAERQAAE